MSILCLTSCSSLRHLENDQLALEENKFIIDKEFKKDFNYTLISELESLCIQKPKSFTILNPRNWFGRKNHEILDTLKTKETATEIKKFLRNKKGFYNCTVEYDHQKNGKEVKALYYIHPAKRYHIKSLEYLSEDKKLLTIIKKLGKQSLVKKGQALDAATFDLEKLRLTKQIQNLGYANFQTNYIEYEGDSLNHQVDVRFKINTPTGYREHTKYTIGDINVYTEHSPNDILKIKSEEIVNQKTYFGRGEKIIVNPRNIDYSIFLDEGKTYKREDYSKSYRKLSELSTYRYIAINPKTNAKQDSILDFDIFLTPYANKWVSDTGFDLFYSSGNQLTNQLFGVSANTRIQDRNFAGGSELYTLDLEGTLEFNINTRNTNFSFRAENNVEFPKHLDLYATVHTLKRLGWLSDELFNKIRKETRTNINLAYNYSSIFNLYDAHSLSASFGYDYRPNNKTRVLLNHLGVNLLRPTTKPAFDAILSLNPLLSRSFEPYITSGFIFNRINYFYQGKKSKKGNQFSFLGSYEISGLESYSLNKLYNAVAGNNSVWQIGSLNFSSYNKIELEARYYKNWSRSQFASRANFGIAAPFGDSEIIPYFAQFYVGGPNSIRAWQIRELGPGQYRSNTSLQPFFQAGDIKMEMNLEYRFDLFWYFEGAFFLEAGNVWTLNNDPNRPFSQITSSFYDDFAVGTGWGFRIDFDYFIIRLDFGYKLRNPYPNPETNKYWDYKQNSLLGNINIAINYPF